MSFMNIYPPNTIDIAIDLPVVAPPKAVMASWAVAAPVPPFAIGKIPVTPVVNTSPVALIRLPEAGVPKIGATSVLLVSVATLEAVIIFVGVIIDDSVVIAYLAP
jgi:hypothetical protein